MTPRDPNNVYFALATLVGVAVAVAYFFGWRTLLRRVDHGRDLDEIYPPPRKDR